MNNSFKVVINRVTDAFKWAQDTYLNTSENLISEEVNKILADKTAREKMDAAIKKRITNGPSEEKTPIEVPNSHERVLI